MTSSDTCTTCDPICNTCETSSTNCLSCFTTFLYDNTCVSSCPADKPYESTSSYKCFECDTGTYFLGSTCYETCPSGYFANVET
jgi:hypothetical protein